MLNRSNCEKELTHLSVHATRYLQRNQWTLFTSESTSGSKVPNYVKSFPIVRNERWASAADLWVETSPTTNDNLLCRLRKKIRATFVGRGRQDDANRIRSSDFCRPIPLSCPIFLIKLRHTMRRRSIACCSIVVTSLNEWYMDWGLFRAGLPISFGLVMLLDNKSMFTERYYQSDFGIKLLIVVPRVFQSNIYLNR